MVNQFIPAKWLSNPHVQTLWPSFFRKSLDLNRVRERFKTPDGDFFDVDWYGSGDKGIVILLHGLTGCSNSHYVLGLQFKLEQQGFTVAAINFRACSGEPNLKAGSYHAGFTNDIHQLYQTVRARHPKGPIYTVGFSLGGNIMLKWLGEKSTELDIAAAVTVSVPYKLANCADKVDQGFSKIYREHLIGAMKKKLANKRLFFKTNNMLKEFEKLDALGDISWVKSFWEFDHHVVAVLHGFDGVDDYYEQCGSISYLKDIKVPTLLIHAKDDPFMSPAVLPQESELSDTTQLFVTDQGGHVGFISRGGEPSKRYWLEQVIPQFIKDADS